MVVVNFHDSLQFSPNRRTLRARNVPQELFQLIRDYINLSSISESFRAWFLKNRKTPKGLFGYRCSGPFVAGTPPTLFKLSKETRPGIVPGGQSPGTERGLRASLVRGEPWSGTNPGRIASLICISFLARTVPGSVPHA